jgi:MoaA/NifB/PqqE/SkfB family radical SAM enzyme
MMLGFTVTPHGSPTPSLTPRDVLAAWWGILSGRAPMLSIEITRECPLSCPGCYAYGESHLGGAVTLRDLSDLHGDPLVNGVLGLVRKHRPMHVSLVGGEPLVRHRELSRILPVLGQMGIFTLIPTSAVIPVPEEWMKTPRLRVAVSVDGLPEHHDIRRKPATYDRILQNIAGREVNIHWVITRPMLQRPGYLEDYVAFWDARPEVNHIWVSTYTPQVGEESAEMLSHEDREEVARRLVPLRKSYPKLLMSEGLAAAIRRPPANPDACIFSKMSVNYSADLTSRVEPCIFGGTPDCSRCGCVASTGIHWLGNIALAGPLRVGHLVESSIRVGRLMNRIRRRRGSPDRWQHGTPAAGGRPNLVQIDS